jgi:2-isopropylmalate synthase
MNLFSQGVDPGLDLSDLPEVARVYEQCCRLPIHPRHPYAGELVFTAFSGSHQDAIKKGLAALDPAQKWEVPYLPIDPADVGRVYEPLVRINSQSGKGGVAFVLERTAGYRIPKDLAAAFSQSVQRVTDRTGGELSAADVVADFERQYLSAQEDIRLERFAVSRVSADSCRIQATILESDRIFEVDAQGNGPIDAFVRGINHVLALSIHCVDYTEHALGEGEDAEAVAYVKLRGNSRDLWGVGRARDIVAASLQGVLRALSRLKVQPSP